MKTLEKKFTGLANIVRTDYNKGKSTIKLYFRGKNASGDSAFVEIEFIPENFGLAVTGLAQECNITVLEKE